MVLSKDRLEAQLHDEKKQISDGRLKDDSPLDSSPAFKTLCEACRKGDLKVCQECITDGVNINARDVFDYTPLILASLCGHYEVVQLLLEAGALCERDTFQGERCLYNALNDRIRNLLLQYDYSKSSDPLQPLASHVTSLLSRTLPKTSDITVTTATESFGLHKFLLSARSPYFKKKLAIAPEAKTWKLPNTVAPQAFEVAIRYLYFGEVPTEIFVGSGASEEEQYVLTGIEKISRQLEITALWDGIIGGGDRRIARQRKTEETVKGRDQLESWYRENILKYKIQIETSRAENVRWDRDNGIFADVLLRADDDVDWEEADDDLGEPNRTMIRNTIGPLNGLPIGPSGQQLSRSPSRTRKSLRQSTLYPVHRAMLIRSEFFSTMFSSSFKEAQHTPYLQIVPIDCSPPVLEVILTYLYTERADVPLELAIDVLYAADLLLIEKLKLKAAVVISTLGNGQLSIASADTYKKPSILTGSQSLSEDLDDTTESINVYDVLRAGWQTRVHRLEEFAARYLAYRLEDYIDEEEFAEVIRESAGRITKRQETDSIELLDDIRYYLSERFRLRFEDSGIDELMEEQQEDHGKGTAAGQADDHGVDGLTQQASSLSLSPNKRGDDEGIDLTSSHNAGPHDINGSGDTGVIRTLDGAVAGDEFASDAINYRILLEKIEGLLVSLGLDA